MNADQQNSDTNKRINNGLRGICLVVTLAVAILVRVLLDINARNHGIYLVVILGVGFGLYALLQRIRPPQQDAGSGWSRFYKFVLTQMDLGTAFKRRK